MLKLEILLSLTFVFGVIRLLTYTKLFNADLIGIVEVVIPISKKHKLIYNIIRYIDFLLFYFSLTFQAYYWLFL